MQRTEHLVTYEVCIVCVRAPARVQSTVKHCLLFAVGASGGHIGNEEYMESYSKTYDGYNIYYTDTLAVLLVHVGLAQARPK